MDRRHLEILNRVTGDEVDIVMARPERTLGNFRRALHGCLIVYRIGNSESGSMR